MSDNSDHNNVPPEGWPCSHIPDDAFEVGVSPEVPDKVVIEFRQGDERFAFAFSQLGAMRLHDGVAASLNMLNPEEDDFDWDDEDFTVH